MEIRLDVIAQVIGVGVMAFVGWALFCHACSVISDAIENFFRNRRHK